MIASILPDIDVLAFRFGIPYASMFGHRGFSHSIFFALLIGCVFRWASAVGRERPWTVFLFTSFATLSHGLLDGLTNGGLGVGFFAPFSGRRYFLMDRWIEVSPIGGAFFSERGLEVLKSELWTVWLPCAAFALVGWWVRRRCFEAKTIPAENGIRA